MSCSFMNIHGMMLSTWQTQVMVAVLQTQTVKKQSRFMRKIIKLVITFFFLAAHAATCNRTKKPAEPSLAIRPARQNNLKVKCAIKKK